MTEHFHLNKLNQWRKGGRGKWGPTLRVACFGGALTQFIQPFKTAF